MALPGVKGEEGNKWECEPRWALAGRFLLEDSRLAICNQTQPFLNERRAIQQSLGADLCLLHANLAVCRIRSLLDLGHEHAGMVIGAQLGVVVLHMEWRVWVRKRRIYIW